MAKKWRENEVRTIAEEDEEKKHIMMKQIRNIGVRM